MRNEANKKLTIIIPVYNMETKIKRCIDSLNQQKFGNDIEIIFVNDGSTDKSGIICDKFASTNKYTKVIHQENLGVASARNVGLREAKGDYIAWIDPDDYITSDWWQTIEPLLNYKHEMIFYDFIIDSNGKCSTECYDDKSCVLNHSELCNELARSYKIQSHLCSKIILRTYYLRLIKKQGYVFDIKMSYSEDFEAMHKICYGISNCFYVCKAIYVYVQHDESIVHCKQNVLAKKFLSIKLAKARYKFYKEKNEDVTPINIFLSTIIFIFCYNTIAEPYERNKLNKEYNYLIKCFYSKEFFNMIIDKQIPIKYKLMGVAVFTHTEKLLLYLKTLKERITK